MSLRRGDIHAYRVAGRTRHLLVVSVDALTAAGTAIVVEVVDRIDISGLQELLTVPLAAPFDGWYAKAWHLNFMSSDRLASGQRVGAVDAATLAQITAAIKAAVEP